MSVRSYFQPDGKNRVNLEDAAGRQGEGVCQFFHRSGGILHRSAVAAVDKLAAPATLTCADVATGGSLVFATTYNASYAAGNAFGPTTPITPVAQLTANDSNSTHAVRMTTAQVTNATYYDVFLSTDAAPKWVARVTEAQRAAGCTVTAVGTVTATSPGANKIDVRVVGTGVQTNAIPFLVNNAVDLAAITPVDCRGYNTARIAALLSVTDFRSAPTLALGVYEAMVGNAGVYYQIASSTFTLLQTTANTPIYRSTPVTVGGPTQLIVTVDVLTGQGAAVDVWVELF
jgi:hypothetical protein